MYADQTYSSPTQELKAPLSMNQSGRFSFIYAGAIAIAAAQVDQNHPEIATVVTDLQGRLDEAQKALNSKNSDFDTQWKTIWNQRGLVPGSQEYTLSYLKWLEDVRYADQMNVYSSSIDRLDAQIGALRRSKYTVQEAALLDNLDALSPSFNLARPRYAQNEIDAAADGHRLTDTTLADPHQTPAALYDSSPLILPIADLRAFLTNSGSRGFDTLTTSRSVSAGSQSWYGSGGASFGGWSVGGSGSGASSYNNDISSLKSVHISFDNVDEIFIDRGQWFNPGVLQDPATNKLVSGLSQLQYLKYVAVSLFVGRGLNMTLNLGHNASNSDWSTSTINAHGGASFLGCSFGGGGGSTHTSSNFTSNADGANITFKDGATVIRVLGARVEPFLINQRAATGSIDVQKSPAFQAALQKFEAGSQTYISLQREKIQSLKTLAP